MPSAAAIFDVSTIQPPLVECNNVISSFDLLRASMDLSDVLLFVQYTPEGTLRRGWYFIQIDMKCNTDANTGCASNVYYLYVTLAMIK